VKLVLQLAGTLALVALGWLCVEGAMTVRYARGRSQYSFDQLNKVLRESSQTMDEVRKAATQWQLASKSQSTQTTAALSNVSAAATALSSFVSRTDTSLNASLIPMASSVLSAQNDALLENQRRLGSNLDALQTTQEALGRTILDADAQISNPALKSSVDAVAASSLALQGITEDMKKGSDMAVQAEYDWLHPAPKKLAVKIMEFLGGHAVSGVELAWYLHNWSAKP
jgi:hypothetical protein